MSLAKRSWRQALTLPISENTKSTVPSQTVPPLPGTRHVCGCCQTPNLPVNPARHQICLEALPDTRPANTLTEDFSINGEKEIPITFQLPRLHILLTTWTSKASSHHGSHLRPIASYSGQLLVKAGQPNMSAPS